MKKVEIIAKKAPKVIGPYSQGITVGDFLYVAGNIGVDPKTNQMVTGGIEEQTKRTLSNIRMILQSAGLDMANVIKTTVYLSNFDNFPRMNEVYATFFPKPYPVRATVEVVRLPKDALVEIECVAHT